MQDRRRNRLNQNFDVINWIEIGMTLASSPNFVFPGGELSRRL
jgi:hypothetical protein